MGYELLAKQVVNALRRKDLLFSFMLHDRAYLIGDHGFTASPPSRHINCLRRVDSQVIVSLPLFSFLITYHTVDLDCEILRNLLPKGGLLDGLHFAVLAFEAFHICFLLEQLIQTVLKSWVLDVFWHARGQRAADSYLTLRGSLAIRTFQLRTMLARFK